MEHSTFLGRFNISLQALALLLLVTIQAGVTHADETEVRLGPGDRVQVTVFGHEDLSGEFEVDNTGRLSLPLIESVRAQGLLPDELELLIVDALQPEFLINPRVTVQLLSFRPFYILGQVNSPGSYPYTGGMTVVNAVAVAGGYTPRARIKRIIIQRTVEGEQTEIAASPEMEIMPGDVIEVPERFF